MYIRQLDARGRPIQLFQVLCSLLLVASCAFLVRPVLAHSALTPDQNGVYARFERISLEQGLSQSSVYCILQDSRGFMWFGTQDGLNQYDGYRFKVYRPIPGSNSLSNNHIWALYEDREGLLWVGTEGGLNRLDPEREQFRHYFSDPADPRSLSSDSVRALYQDREGFLWVGTYGGGLNRFDPETEKFVRYTHDPKDSGSLSSNYVQVIYQDGTGALWIGTAGGGLDRFDPERGRFTHYQHNPGNPYSLSDNTVQAIYEDQEGVLWIGTGQGLNRLNPDGERFIRYFHLPEDSSSLSHNSVTAILEDREGTLWVGTVDGLTRLNRSQSSRPGLGEFAHYWHNPGDSTSLSNDTIWSLYQDREGLLWVGTYGGGLNKLNLTDSYFIHYRSEPQDPNSLGSNYVWSIFEDRGGRIWIGTVGGLERFDRTLQQFSHYRGGETDPYQLGNTVIRSICQDQEGMLWIGTDGAGVYRFDPALGQYTSHYYASRDAHGLGSNAVRVVHVDREGMLWIGTYGGGLDRLDPGQVMDSSQVELVHYRAGPAGSSSLSSDFVWSIYEDREGVLWIGTRNGLNQFDRAQDRFLQFRFDLDNPLSLSSDSVLSIHEDRDGVLWVGTSGGGLNKLDRETGTFTHYREQEGLPNDVVYGILEDEQGFLWLSTNKGLSRFDPGRETFYNYGPNDGLQSNEFNLGAYLRSSRGEMFFGGINGFNVFYPEQITGRGSAPPVVLTGLTQGGEPVAAEASLGSLSQVTLRWPNNFFEFEYAALSYVQPAENLYAYMLEGFDPDWVQVGSKHFGRYTNLPGGSYTLRIRGSNHEGIWNEEGFSLQVVVVPPFWQREWFQGLVVLVLLAAVAGGYRWRVRSIEARSQVLEEQVAERTQALAQRTLELEERNREIERRRQELESLYRADEELHRHLDLDQVLPAPVHTAGSILQADKGSLLVWDERRERLVVQASFGFSPETAAGLSLAPGQGLAGRVAVSGEPAIVRDTHLDDRVTRELVEAEGIRALMQVPITVGGEVFGVFSVDYLQPREFDGEERRLLVALAQRAALAIENAQLYEQAQELAVVQERNRLARELHDAVTQSLFSASLIAQVLPDLWVSDQEEGRQLLQELRQLSRGALAEMRTLLLELRPAALVETSMDDLLRQLAEAVRGREDLSIAVMAEGPCLLPPDVHVALYRIAQEALNNVVKHAQAGQVEIELHSDFDDGARCVVLSVCDDGGGFDPKTVPPERLGLGIIRERAQAIGARLEIHSRPGQGTQVVVNWQDGAG